MTLPAGSPNDHLSQRLADRAGADPELAPWLDQCLRRWAGVSYDAATVADLQRASRAVAAEVVDRSPMAAAAMAGRTGFTAAELLQALGAREGKAK